MAAMLVILSLAQLLVIGVCASLVFYLIWRRRKAMPSRRYRLSMTLAAIAFSLLAALSLTLLA